jgi:hypothetical protein
VALAPSTSLVQRRLNFKVKAEGTFPRGPRVSGTVEGGDDGSCRELSPLRGANALGYVFVGGCDRQGQGLHAFEHCCIGQGELGALLEHAAHGDHLGPLFDGSDECRHGPLAAF